MPALIFAFLMTLVSLGAVVLIVVLGLQAEGRKAKVRQETFLKLLESGVYDYRLVRRKKRGNGLLGWGIVFTALFIFVIASTSRKSMPPGLTGITVGLMLTLIHLVTIPVDNTSVNPVRSLSTAVFQGGWALNQLWMFIVFPIVGGVIGAVVWRALVPAEDA